ncbi:MAG: hypothetical protein E7593_03945 [Ruminococcaceae bacterium]|nr:hypothetical protein [Oscillospiraceae bacterium]
MKNVFKTVIEKGDYDLTALIKKIDTYHIEGKITDEERNELCSQARVSPKAQYNYDTEIEKLWEAVRALQKNETNNGATEDIPEWKQPTGAHDAYITGNVMRYTDGKVYVSMIDNNVWSPDTYPAGWEVVEE